MYSTCLFCRRPLGTNEAVERFPVGRRLAFDPAKGRLWVVCRSCERWNLTPIEERWEAIEDCERRFRGTSLRVSTDHIGLARLREGLDLVRIGDPQRPEFAAWRYGDQFGRRRIRTAAQLGAGAAAVTAIGVGGIAIGAVTTSSLWGLYQFSGAIKNFYENRRVVGRVRTDSGSAFEIRVRDIHNAQLVGSATKPEWRLRIDRDGSTQDFEGRAALHASSIVLARINRLSGSSRNVGQAVSLLEAGGGPAKYVYSLSCRSGFLEQLPVEKRLALEMATHEETEHRALEGELAELEQAWRDAEEIAGIADNLLIPPAVEEWLRSAKRA